MRKNLLLLGTIAGLLGSASMFGGYGFKSPPPPKQPDEEKMSKAEAKRQRKADKRKKL